MHLLLIGSGAREHALASRMLESSALDELYWLPGNAALEGRVTKVRGIDPCDGPSIATWAQHQGIDLAVIGPEAPLLAGVADCLEEVGIPCFGPGKAAAQLEGSKAFAKDLMAKYGIPTAAYAKVADAQEALSVVEEWGAPVVVKADGLAAGKGVTVATNLEQARQAATELTGPAVIEECLQGKELSFMVLAQGKQFVPLVPSRDYKRVGDGDTGPNTGGMGAVAGFDLVNQALHQEICTRIVTPTLEAMAEEGIPYKGVLYVGLMLTDHGPQVLEFNVRFGDPETQAILQLWEDDLLEVFTTVARGEMPRGLTWSQGYGLSLVLTSQGYPGKYQTGYVIEGLDDSTVYQAGTKLEGGKILTNGGRVLTLAAAGNTVVKAKKRAYIAAEKVSFQDMYFRRDIGDSRP